MVGQTFGFLKVIEMAGIPDAATTWLCLCRCGKEVTVRVGSLTSGNTKSCGCSRRKDPIARFNKYYSVDAASGCWLWTGCLDGNGYGKIGVDNVRKGVGAHRFSYELHVGPIPDGLQIDHLCRVRNCINPEHLEPVTSAVNTARGMSVQRRKEIASARTHCRYGHPFVSENLMRRKDGYKRCKQCRQDAYVRKVSAAGKTFKPRGYRQKMVALRGQEMNFTAWCRLAGRSKGSVYHQLNRGRSLEDALFGAIQRGRPKVAA